MSVRSDHMPVCLVTLEMEGQMECNALWDTVWVALVVFCSSLSRESVHTVNPVECPYFPLNQSINQSIFCKVRTKIVDNWAKQHHISSSSQQHCTFTIEGGKS